MSDISIALHHTHLEFYPSHNGAGYNADNGLYSAICVRLFTDKRADETLIANPYLRRGWWGDALLSDNSHTVGSHLWVLQRQIINAETLRRVEDYTHDALQDLLDRHIVTNIKVTAIAGAQGVLLNIICTRQNGADERFEFAWNSSIEQGTKNDV